MDIKIKLSQMITFAITTVVLLKIGDGDVALEALFWGGVLAIVLAYLRKRGAFLKQTRFLLYMIVGHTYASGLAILFLTLRT